MKSTIPSLLGALGIGICITSGTAAAATVIVAENFGGLSTTNLAGTTADTFSSAIVTAGGSATWAGHEQFKADGSVAGTIAGSAYLNLGSYINATKGQTNGLFELTATISPVTGTWLTVGFSSSSAPGTGNTFINGGGLGTMAYRANGDIDQWAGSGSSNQVAADDITFSGNRTLTITLDLRNHNGTSNFGSVSFSDSVAGVFGSFNYTSNQNFNSILLSTATTQGTYSDLTLTQVPEPGAALLGGLGLLALLRRRRP
jgi:MYXO-CTERM domain-containing protein